MIRKLITWVLLLLFLALIILLVYNKTNNNPIFAKSVNTDVSSVQVTEQEAESEQESDKEPAIGSLNVEKVQEIVKNYIMDNPEVILASLETMKSKKTTEDSDKTLEFLQANKKAIEQDDSMPFLGNPNGDITIVVFYDYNCSFCKKAHEYEKALIAADSKVKILLRPIPILGESSNYAAKVALAVHKVSKKDFPNIHNELMHMKIIDEKTVRPLLEKYKIDYSLIENEVNSYAIKQLLNKDFDFARNLGIKGTPSYVIDGHFVPGFIDLEKFKDIIMQIRALNSESKGTGI